MDGIDTGGQAFPCGYYRNGNREDRKGMSMRDYFAGQALVGIISNPQSSSEIKIICRDSYKIADAMLEERKK